MRQFACLQRASAAEEGVPYRSDEGDLLNFSNMTPEYLALNPRGVVPTWVDGDTVVFDSPTIIRYIDAHYVGPSLRGGAHRDEVEQWIDLGDEFPNRYMTYYQMYEIGGHSLENLDIAQWVKGLLRQAESARSENPELADLYQAKLVLAAYVSRFEQRPSFNEAYTQSFKKLEAMISSSMSDNLKASLEKSAKRYGSAA